MSSDLLGIERAAAGGRSAFSSGKLSEGPSHDHLGRKLSNYDRWRVQQGKDDSATSTSTSIPITVTHSGSGGVGGVGGGRRKTNASSSSSSRGNNSNSVRFADAPETRTFRADEDDDAVVGGDSLSALREMSMGPSASRYSSSSSARSPSARATSLKPEMSSSSSSSYRPSFGSSSSYSSPSSYAARSFPTGVANKVTYTGIPHLKDLS